MTTNFVRRCDSDGDPQFFNLFADDAGHLVGLRFPSIVAWATEALHALAPELP